MRRLLYSLQGNSQKIDGGTLFGNAPKALWQRWMPADEQNRISLSSRCLLVREDNRRILFETGIGSFFPPKYKKRYGIAESHHVLLDNLDRLGLTDRDIDIVVLSHLHFQQAGGLLSSWREKSSPQLLFPNATFLVTKSAWERAKSPHLRDKANFVEDIQNLLEASNRLKLIDGTSCPTLGSDYRLHITHGHSPGLLTTEIQGKNGPVLFASNLIPGRAWVHRSITMGYDRFPEKLIEEKGQLLHYLSQHHGRVFFNQDPYCAMSRISRDEFGKYGSMQDMSSLHAYEA